MNPFNKITSFLFIAVIAFIFIILKVNSCSKYKDKYNETSSLLTALNDTLKAYRDIDNHHIASIYVMEGTIKELKSLKAKDSSEIVRLKKIIDKKTNSAVIVTTSTTGNVNSGTIITKIDTIRIDTCNTIVYPTYATTFENKWEKFNVIATKDSFNIKYKVFNDFEIVEKVETKGIWPFEKKNTLIEIKNNNPNTETITMRSFKVKQNKPKRLNWLLSGVAAGAIATFYLKK